MLCELGSCLFTGVIVRAALNNVEQPPDSEIPIPKYIWQIFFPPPGTAVIEHDFVHADAWIELSPGYTYTLVGARAADAFIADNFANRPEIATAYHALTNPALKSDFLRYLLLYIHGGVYSDVDTKPVVRLDDWIPPEKRRQVKFLVAVEYDESLDPHPDDFTYKVQFCQWTIAAAPGHVVFGRMIDRVLEGLRDVAAAQGTTLDMAEITNYNVLNTTGPVAWTEVVFRLLQEMDPNIKSYDDVSQIREPWYLGDTVVMPLETFRADYLDEWRVSWRKGRKALVRHFFKGGWKKNPEQT
ncbi:initiation-specific alpha-1,6-mannosyltransferase [Echria macrotheca]|uniref:Initiation-specific alpha-1,6-mannosyltransferase n=1 Tax=Echria macrotheca TaxID=438768 RepID=A0AAJ0F9L4_9PEZI|nr:initiation-specific alpha-1,6-mannosyltransferase [Echria macrotheca]